MSDWFKSSYSGSSGSCIEIAWRKSTYSSHGSSCVEVGWHKSSYSSHGSDCVEVAEGSTVLVRDTQNRPLGHIEYPPAAWSALLKQVKTQK